MSCSKLRPIVRVHAAKQVLRWHSAHVRELVLRYYLWSADVAIALASVSLDEEAEQDEEEDDAERDRETDEDDESEGEVVSCG